MGTPSFLFTQPKNTAVLICDGVKDGKPILFACRDAEGDFQFLCGGDHPNGGEDKPLLVCLDHVVEGDLSLNGIADLARFHTATRISAEAPWVVHDDMEDAVRDNIKEHGWHGMKVPEDDAGPGFVYTIGLYRTFGHPEMICIGLPLDVAHQGLWECARHIRAGGTLGDGCEFWEAFQDARCAFRTVLTRHYREYLGYARWYYEGDAFPVVQMLWPDSCGKLPGDEGCAESTVRLQTPLWKA